MKFKFEKALDYDIRNRVSGKLRLRLENDLLTQALGQTVTVRQELQFEEICRTNLNLMTGS